MKKIVSLILLLLLSITLVKINGSAYIDAYDLDITNLFDTWTIEENSGTYILKSNRIENKAKSIRLELETMYVGSNSVPDSIYNIEHYVVDQLNTEKSRVDIYDDEQTIHKIGSYYLEYEVPENTGVLYLSDGIDGWQPEMVDDTYYEIKLVLRDDLSISQRDRILNTFNNHQYWGDTKSVNYTVTGFFENIIIDPTVSSEFALLPETSGSIFSDTNGMGSVSLAKDGYKVSMIINYDATYYLEYTFASETDMSIFDASYEVFYYTYENQKFILINHGTTSMFMANDWRTETFVPYTIWNLNTNELSTVERFNVYMYVRPEEANHIAAYFYVDDFIIDRLMSVSLDFEYRYVNIFGNKGSWTPYISTLEDEEVVDPTTSWQFKAASISTVSTVIGSSIPVVGLPIMIIGTPISLYFQYLTYEQIVEQGNFFTGSTNEITKVNPSIMLRNEIDTAYQDAYPNFLGLNLSTYSLWRLDFGAFNKPLQNSVEIKDDSMNIIQFTYQTDGKVYTIDEQEINLINPVHPELEETPDTDSNWWDDILEAIGWIGMIIAGGIVVLILVNLNKFIDSFMKIATNPKKLILVGVIIIIALYILGVF